MDKKFTKTECEIIIGGIKNIKNETAKYLTVNPKAKNSQTNDQFQICDDLIEEFEKERGNEK